ncbi:hypothetical protein RHGRI_018677 [Rhododendron griersonianum]|uniref:Uncharacterized protein n=1 Tax=Rhododendron griersonianum TaxID=479676 RepID=A0AAV6K2F0_9ERIC|nr:hypothetical protein RHGRI_018677 [Rhododendron griersonianum]
MLETKVTYVPQLSQAISRYNSAGNEKNNKLEGIHDRMISDESYKQLNLVCDSQSFIHPSGQFDKALDMASEELGEIDPYSILTPPCTATSSFWFPLLLYSEICSWVMA